MRSLFLILTLLFSGIISVNADLVVYPAPKGAELNADFTVSVRQNNELWQLSPSYQVKVDEVRYAKHNVELASMA